MIRSFSLENFKCYDTIEVKNLRRINIVTGDNGTGKTALLEGLLFAARGVPEALQAANQARGLNPLGAITVPIFSSYIDEFFRNYGSFSTDGGSGKLAYRRLRASFVDSKRKKTTVEARLMNSGLPFATIGGPTNIGGEGPVLNVLRHTPSGTSKIEVSVAQNGQLKTEPQNYFSIGPTCFYFPASTIFSESDNVIWYSQLREKNQAAHLVTFLKKEFGISNLEALGPTGINGLYAVLKDGTPRRISMVSTGINKLVSILLAITINRNGIVIIDEIENGFFYSRAARVWQVIYEFAKESECQIVASSHSLEFLQAMSPLAQKNPNDFCLLRTTVDDKKYGVETVLGKQLAAALAGNVEIR